MHADTTEELEALLQFLYMAPIGLVQAHTNGEILMVNPLCAQLLMPLSCDGELSNLYTALSCMAPDLEHRVRSFAKAHGTVCDAVLLQAPSTGARQNDAQVLSLTLLKLDTERMMAVIGDVTQSVKRERELRQSQAWIDTLIMGITDYALMSLDHAGRIEAWNPGVARITGFDAAAIIGGSYACFYAEDSLLPAHAQDRLHEADSNGWSMDEGWRVRADGSRFWGSCLISPLRAQPVPDSGAASRGYSLIIRDISDRREAREALRQAVSCDHLTGLSNRRAFFEAAEAELQRTLRMPRPLSLVVIDADHFKAVNDRHGHAAGDAVLRHLAAGLRATFGPLDTVARMGGEEFAVLLPATAADAAAMLATRVCQALSAHAVTVEGTPIRYTVSAGVATLQAPGDSIEALLKRADTALFAAKNAGRNRSCSWSVSMAGARLAA